MTSAIRIGRLREIGLRRFGAIGLAAAATLLGAGCMQASVATRDNVATALKVQNDEAQKPDDLRFLELGQ